MTSRPSKFQQQVLEELGKSTGLTYREVVVATGLAPSTVRRILVRLGKQNQITKKFNFKDARQLIYLKAEPPGVTGNHETVETAAANSR